MILASRLTGYFASDAAASSPLLPIPGTARAASSDSATSFSSEFPHFSLSNSSLTGYFASAAAILLPPRPALSAVSPSVVLIAAAPSLSGQFLGALCEM